MYCQGKTLILFLGNIYIGFFVHLIHLEYTVWICIADYSLWENKWDSGVYNTHRTTHFNVTDNTINLMLDSLAAAISWLTIQGKTDGRWEMVKNW